MEGKGWKAKKRVRRSLQFQEEVALRVTKAKEKKGWGRGQTYTSEQ